MGEIRVTLLAMAEKTAVLPDFSWYKIPKREKHTKLPQNIQNVYKIYQKTIK
jgi:hypothetical protein